MTKSSTLDRLLAIVLALLMMVSLMPVQAFADVEETPVEEVTEQVVETPTDPAVEQTPVEQVVETPVEEVTEQVVEDAPAEEVVQAADFSGIVTAPRPVDVAQTAYSASSAYAGYSEEYTDLATALREAGGSHTDDTGTYAGLGTEVMLISNAIINTGVVFKNGNITLDLNGKTVTFQDGFSLRSELRSGSRPDLRLVLNR